MPRPWGLLCGLITCLACTLFVSAAGPDEPPGERPVWGTVVAAGADALTVQPEPPARRTSRRHAPPAGAERYRAERAEAKRAWAERHRAERAAAERAEAPPAERTFTIDKDRTEVAFVEVARALPMADGTTLRVFNDPVPATLGDLKAGLAVQVTAREGVATQILIGWGVRGTLVRAGPDSITYRPDSDEGGDTVDEQTVKADPEKTAVQVQTLVAEGPAERGGFVRSYENKQGRLADLKAGDPVIVFVKDGAAAKVTVLPPPADRRP